MKLFIFDMGNVFLRGIAIIREMAESLGIDESSLRSDYSLHEGRLMDGSMQPDEYYSHLEERYGIQVKGDPFLDFFHPVADEDILRMDLEEAGYRSVYAEGALVLNRGPENLRDFFKQRVLVNIGELYMKKCFRYQIPTHDYRKLYAAMLQSIKDVGFHPVKLTIAVLMELATRLYALAYVKADKGDMSVWDRVDSTKIV